jgi:hypothetical protein
MHIRSIHKESLLKSARTGHPFHSCRVLVVGGPQAIGCSCAVHQRASSVARAVRPGASSRHDSWLAAMTTRVLCPPFNGQRAAHLRGSLQWAS